MLVKNAHNIICKMNNFQC